MVSLRAPQWGVDGGGVGAALVKPVDEWSLIIYGFCMALDQKSFCLQRVYQRWVSVLFSRAFDGFNQSTSTKYIIQKNKQIS